MRNCLCPLLLVLCFPVLPSLLYSQSEGAFTIDAPADAWLEGERYPYYGSENPWTRRMFSEKATSWQYKRRGQRQMLKIIEGRPAEAVDLAKFRLGQMPDDMEAMFILTLGYAQLGDLDESLRYLQMAVDSGLPFERFQAGPRDLLESLYETDTYRQMVKEKGSMILHGPMLGGMTDESVIVWLRTAAASEVEVRAYRAGFGEEVSRVRIRTESEADYTGRGRLSGLDPATHYEYRIWVDGEAVETGLKQEFKTYPEAGNGAGFTVAFGGCAGYTPWNERIWDEILTFNPDALLLLGDNVYIDIPDEPGSFHQYTMYRRQSRSEFRRLTAQTPVYAIWDDHDAGFDDIWMGPFRDRPKWKMPYLEFFRENWPNPGFGSREWPAVWHRFSVGDVDFFMLDGRFYRTHPFDEEATMLGPDQLAWLKRELRQSKATFKVLVSPVNWNIGSKEGSRDTWQGFPRERDEIFRYLTNEGIEGVFLVSSDRHRADVWKIEREGDYPLWEFANGQLTNLHTHPVVPSAEFSYNEKNMFGLLRFRTDIEDPWVNYIIVTIDGEVVYSKLLRSSEMRIPTR